MTKAYFYLKNLFSETVTNTGDEYLCKILSLKVGGVEQLTSDYNSETTNVYQVPFTNWEFSDCTDNGTQIDACGLTGLIDSWNPFFSNLAGTYDNVVNSKNRGSFLASNSSNLYGIEGFGFGFDKIAVPINDIPSGGSTGASSSGSFFVNFDETQNFELIVQVQSRTSLSVAIADVRHLYTYNAITKTILYTYQDVLPAIPSSPISAIEWAFLSGGLAGWIDTGAGSSPGALGDDPIVTRSVCTVPNIPTVPPIVIEELDECCYQSPVLASTTSNDSWKNDINSFLFKRNFSSESITLTLQKNGTTDIPIVNDDFGKYYDFGSIGDFPNYKGVYPIWLLDCLLPS